MKRATLSAINERARLLVVDPHRPDQLLLSAVAAVNRARSAKDDNEADKEVAYAMALLATYYESDK